MKIETTTTGEATYCPEDNKLRLYVGRVPRDEFLALRAEGWAVCSKQREAGKGDFAAVWTPEREDTALMYSGGYIGDEDAGPAERAADRAERFAGYLDNRLTDARGEADKYDQGPSVHGYQDAGKAMRAADRHDKQADRACNNWSKAEYWQRRTSGVISHALYLQSAHVRMGRIKGLEADIRRCEHNQESRWLTHYKLRLAYEQQMLEAQGGRAGELEIEVGGFWRGAQVLKVNKSAITGRVVSVGVKVKAVEGWHYNCKNVSGTDYAILQDNVERAAPGSYRPPTDEEREAFKVWQKEVKATKKATLPKALPLINPTLEEAEKLQAIWDIQNAAYRGFQSDEPRGVLKMTQAEYSLLNKRYYTKGETVELEAGGRTRSNHYNALNLPAVVKVRSYSSRVVVLTDKPQKALPVAVWNDPRPAMKAEILERLAEVLKIAGRAWHYERTPEEAELFRKARLVGLAYQSSSSQFGLSEEGYKEARARGLYTMVNA